jgi:tRNA(Ile)-lysidine synthase
MSYLERTRRFAQRHALWRADTRVLAAVSGGSDSVAMLLLLHDLDSRGELKLDAMAHLNHGIRAEADDDEAFCRALAQRLGVSFLSACVDVPGLARQRRQSIEVAARVARKQFLEDTRRSRAADCVATGHTKDDQAELVVMRLMRGAGRRGLAAMAPRRGRLIRPVLWAARQELRDELGRRDQAWLEDSTNADLSNPRNRVRHELLPYLEQHFNPAVRHSLLRAADVARSDEELLARLAAAATVGILRVAEGSAHLDRDRLLALPDALSRRVVLHALSTVRPQTSGAFGHVEAVMDVAHGRCTAADLSGLRVEHSRGSVVLVSRDLVAAAVAPFLADLPIPGEVQLPEAGVVVQAVGPFVSLEASGVGSEAGGHEREVRVAADGLGQRLIVRSRQKGDWLRPLGLAGRKKVQDVLVDRKVPRADRDRVPIVTDANGRIVWVAGHVVGEEFKVTDRTNAVIILKLRRISGAGIRPGSRADS